MSEAVRKKRPADLPDPKALQRSASDPAASVWVGASAGSGKTTVLVSRVLRLLLAGVEPQKILCLTFTRAAAAEMANRITRALGFWAVCSDEELRQSFDDIQGEPPAKSQLATARRLFARMLNCPGGMRIRTIHGFCQEILRRFPIEARLPPHFAVIEDIDAHALLEDTQNEFLLAAAAAPESAFGKALRRLVGELGERGFVDAMRAVINNRDRIEAALAQKNGLEKLIRNMHDLLELAPGEGEEHLRTKASDKPELPHADLLHAARLLLEGTKTYIERGQNMLAWLELAPAARAAAFTLWCRCFFTGGGDAYKNFADKKLLDKHPEIDTFLRKECARLQSVRERLEAARMAEITAALLTLGGELIRRFEARKAQQALLDYDDLVIRAENLLHRSGIAPWVLYKLDGGLDHILVDEAQDTSRAQWRIVEALADEFFAGAGTKPDINRTLFVVGDEKQSIFSFQNADPEAFAEMHTLFAKRIEDAEKTFRPVDMHMSFRSAPAILRAVDAIFANDRARDGVAPEPIVHYAAKEGLYGRVELWPLLPAIERDKHGEDWVLPLGYEPERDPQAELAARIAGHIRHLVAREGKRYGDVMILMRQRGRFADLMVRALKKAEIPVTGVDRMELVKQLAVMDLLALMQFALLPEDDLNLACVLRGPLLGLSEEQLMQLAIDRKGTLWQSLGEHAEFAAAHGYLRRWLAEADIATPFAMLAHMLHEPCPGSAVSGRQALWGRLGPDALDPIDELLNAAQQFTRTHTPSLQAFLHWLTATEAEIKRELDQGSGQVRIMTVHAAKGLEAPIVFLPDAASLPRALNVPKLLWNKGELPLYLARRPQTGVARRMWDEARQKQMQEYRRLFYVALTRAIERLYICGWESARREADAATDSWYALARAGLQPLHEPAARDEASPADIVFADHDTGIKTKADKISPAKNAKKPKSALHAVTTVLPAWAREAAREERAAPKPLAPSRLAAEAEPPAASPDARFARGIIIHRLLQSLPELDDGLREEATRRFLANPQHRLDAPARKDIEIEVLRLLRHPDYASLFAAGSRAEVSLAGYVDGQPVSGQIDRLCVRDTDIAIVDYKTNRPPPERIEDAAPAYIKQLAAYRSVLRDIYPGKPIRCYLLWTYAPRLMPVPDKMLDDA
jgi:ATP-dependent helicase/nuclease subunit A